LPSALAASVTVLLFFWYFGRELGRRAGLIAGLVVPMSVLWLDKASAAEIDMVQVAWVSAAVLFFLRAIDGAGGNGAAVGGEVHYWLLSCVGVPALAGMERRPPKGGTPTQQWPWWLAALGCVAGGVLTKWTAPAFFYATAITLLWRRGQLRLLWRAPHLI